LSADRADLRVAPQVVDTGNRFLLIGVASEADLAGLSVDQGAVARISDALDLIGFYVFAATGDRGFAHATSRMFAPRYGIPEESATGMAAGPLACLLHDVLGDRRTHFVIEQGRFMASPSVSRILVDLEVEGGGISGLMAGGEGQTARTLQIEPCQPV
jgi:PhzF family phenazine biosynthesis protein